jgi:transcriptional regulator with XRE-family HTH domain
MGSQSIKQRRTRLGLTQQQIAKMLGVSQQTIARWESGGDVPSKYLKDLAIILVCRVSDLVGESTDARGGSRVLRILNRTGQIDEDEDDEQVPYGTARAVFLPRRGEQPAAYGEEEESNSPLVHEYPIAVSEMKQLYSRLQNDVDRGTWFELETLDNRLVLINRSELEAFEMIGDDVSAMPPFEHEEVYAALSDPDLRAILEGNKAPPEDDDSANYSKTFVHACTEVVDDWGGMDAVLDRVAGVTIETVTGQRKNLYSDPDEEAYERISSLVFALELDWNEVNTAFSEQMIELSTEGYYRSSLYRLGALRLIEVPLHAYNAALLAALEENAPHDEAAE